MSAAAQRDVKESHPDFSK